MTQKEKAALYQREQIAALIAAGASYLDIQRQTGASTATISRVKRLMEGRE